jgi:predicted RND superfamily exporter protein
MERENITRRKKNATNENVAGDLAFAVRRFAYIPRHLIIVAFCSSTAVAIVFEISFTSLITSLIDAIACTAHNISIHGPTMVHL